MCCNSKKKLIIAKSNKFRNLKLMEVSTKKLQYSLLSYSANNISSKAGQ